MSVERFFQQYNDIEDFFQEVLSPNPNREQKSTVRFMADKLTSQGREGLVEIGPNFLDAVIADNQKDVQRFTGAYLKNSSAVYLGVSIMAIEDIIRDGHFDANKFNAELNRLYKTTYLDPVLIEYPEIETISTDRLKDITTVASADKTFSKFFNQEFSALPSRMRTLLNQNDYYLNSPISSNINNLILRDYEKRASILLRFKSEQAA